MKAFFRKQEMDIPHDRSEEQLKALIETCNNELYMQDNRRIMWIVERAWEETSEKMTELETRFVVAERFKQTNQMERLKEQHKRYEEDFVYLDAILSLIKLKSMEAATEAFVASYRTRKSNVPKKK